MALQTRDSAPFTKVVQRRKPFQAKPALGKLALYIVLAVGSLFFLVPFFWLVSTSLKTPDQIFTYPIQWLPDPPQWFNYIRLFDLAPFGRYILNTVVLTTFGVVGTVLGSSIAAYAFARMRFRGKRMMFIVMLSTMMVPTWITVIPSYILFSRIGWIDTYLPMLVPAFFAAPFYTFLLRQFFMAIPLDVEEAARLDGASTARIFFTIILPMSKPAIMIVVIFSFLAHWNDFVGPLIYLNTQSKFPISLGIANFIGDQRADYALTMAGAAIAMAPCIILFFIAQKWFMQGIVVTGSK